MILARHPVGVFLRATLVVICAAVGLSCSDPVRLSGCGVSCGESNNVGECRRGITTCSSTGAVTGCRGAKNPTREKCDGLDNDCDGMVDDDLSITGSSCGTDVGICTLGFYLCRYGKLVCFSETPPEVETCNGLDDDCNGLADDHLPIEFCYTGPDSTATHLPCHPGIKGCTDGAETCPNEYLPDPGESCDGIDNDCNGVIDDVPPQAITGRANVKAVIDVSGSMQIVIANVKIAVIEWLDQCSTCATAYTFWITYVGMPNIWPIEPVPDPECQGCDAYTFRRRINQVMATTGGDEPTYDALFDVATSTTWEPGARRFVILFTDEPGYTNRGLTEADVAAAFAANNVTLLAYVAPIDTPSYDDIIAASGGVQYEVGADPIDIAESFGENFIPACE